jgi:hypothetical protein
MRLKKLSRVKTSRRLNTAMFVKAFARVQNAIPFKWDDGATTILLVAIGVSAAVMLNAALRSGEPVKVATANVQLKNATAQTRATRPPDATTASALLETPAKVSAQQLPVTLTGCLEHDNDAFRLKDTTGENAPKSRSWKSGFLKKKTPTIEVVDRANRLQLPDHVGERVVVTGMLVDREMQVRSLRRVATSCKDA